MYTLSQSQGTKIRSMSKRTLSLEMRFIPLGDHPARGPMNAVPFKQVMFPYLTAFEFPFTFKFPEIYFSIVDLWPLQLTSHALGCLSAPGSTSGSYETNTFVHCHWKHRSCPMQPSLLFTIKEIMVTVLHLYFIYLFF